MRSVVFYITNKTSFETIEKAQKAMWVARKLDPFFFFRQSPSLATYNLHITPNLRKLNN